MRTEEVLKNIFRIPVKLPENPLKELNSYLIRDPERSMLIDTGFRHPECKEALLAGLHEIGEDPGKIDIFLTHMHADHSGQSSEFIGGGMRILIGEFDGRWLEQLPAVGGKWQNQKWAWSVERDILAGMPRCIMDNMEQLNPALKFAPPGGERYTLVSDGEVLSCGGYSLRCILTPGHTPGHMCLWDEQSGLMFTGDHVLFDITPNITAWPTIGDSLGDYLDSLRAIREYPVKAALPGHRKSGDFHARIDELLRHHRTRLAEVESIIRDDPGLTAYEIAGRMRWKIRTANWDEFPATQKIFAVGECLSHLDYLLLRDSISREIDGQVYRYFKKQGQGEAP
jgi:glyoxylase-like metal-dependent hydrolase (beta-lactamase superfamily II)